MNRQRILVIALAAVLVAGGAYMWAQRSAAAVKPVHTTAAKKPVAGAKPTAPRPTAKPGTAPAAANAAANAANAPKPAAVPPLKSTASPAPATPTKAAVVDTKAATQPTKSAPVAAAIAPAAAPTAIPAALMVPASWQDQLQKGSYLSEKLKARLPEGADVLAASNGFRDLQQFVATASAAHNLKVDFEELKRRVLTDRKGLAHAIDGMKKVASATIEEQRAEYEARGLIYEAKMQPAPAAPAAKNASTKDQPKKPFRTPSGS